MYLPFDGKTKTEQLNRSSVLDFSICSKKCCKTKEEATERGVIETFCLYCRFAWKRVVLLLELDCFQPATV